MNHYHIYEAIGRGKYSTVYKGRKKKTIEYYAIKSVDKAHRSKVLQEVRILHTLDHCNVLKFYSWYETSAHLWLVLEYCVGGDLMTLLQQDGKLPEDSIHDLARDLLSALQYLHSKGIIYCDLKPSNILLDENGHTKLCDFGLARKLSDVSVTPSSQLPQAKRGTPCYMAPELFQDGGVHSYASDFWALGCVLYECYTGKPPFVEKEFTQLAKSIISDATPDLPGNPSLPFVNLVNSLLIKDPAERIKWPELCSHACWRTRLTPVTLPPQPAFDNMIELSSEPRLTERNGDRPIRNRTPPKTFSKDSRGPGKQDENLKHGLKGEDTPGKGVSSSRKIQTKPSGRKLDVKHKDIGGINVLRLSRIAKSNLQRENEKENYRRPLPNSSKNDSEVKIENHDMELDFNETTEDDGHDETDGSDSALHTIDDNISTPSKHEAKLEEADSIRSQSNTSNVDGTPSRGDPKTQENELYSERMEVSSASTPPTASPQPKNPRTKDISGRALDFDAVKSSTDLSDVLWHPSDLSVRPVMPSRKFDKGSDAIPSLPFQALAATDFAKLPKEKLDVLYNRILSIMNGNINGEKQNVIRYLEMLSTNADVANVLTNGPIMLVLVKMLRQSKALALRVQLTSLMGLLIRHSTFIGDDLANSGILSALTDGLRDRQEKVRRFSMAALGELLFYISTLNEPTGDNNPRELRPSSVWQVPNSLISLISSVLRRGEDDLTQIYALRTIENISSHGGYWATRFTSQDVISNLCYIYKAPGKQESMRLTAGSCLVRLVRFSSPSIQQVIEKLPLKDIASSLFKGNQREQQICLNLLTTAMLGSQFLTNFGRQLLSLMEDKNLGPNLVSLIEQGSEVLRGKTLLFVALLCKNGRRWLSHFLCNARLLSAVDRLAKEKDKYVQQCQNGFVHIVASIIPGLLETITGDVQQLMGGRRPGQSAGSRNPPKNGIHFFPVVLHLLGSSSFKHSMVTPQVLHQVANLLKLTESPFQGRDDFQITLLRVLESITEEPAAINHNHILFICQVLPSLAALYKGNNDGDGRFLCFKIFFDVMCLFLNEGLEDEQRREDLKFISNNSFLPLYPSLIEDEDPIPVYAQKLLVMLIESSYIKISDILHVKAVSQCFEFLRGDFSTINVSNVLLCLALTSAPELESKILSQLKVVRKIGNLLEFVHAKEMEDFVEPTLGLCKAFLLRSVTSRKGIVNSKDPMILYDVSIESAADPQQCIKDIIDFGGNVGVLLELSKSSASNIAELASECLILLFKAAPREATMNFLLNLPKTYACLEAVQYGVSHLVVERILHAIGFSCRQYLLHAMILSISISELVKIETIISDLRGSGIHSIAEASSRAALELQRMPH